MRHWPEGAPRFTLFSSILTTWFTKNHSNSSILMVWFTENPGNFSSLIVDVWACGSQEKLIISVFLQSGSHHKNSEKFQHFHRACHSILVIPAFWRYGSQESQNLITPAFLLSGSPKIYIIPVCWLSGHKSPRNASILIGLQHSDRVIHRHSIQRDTPCMWTRVSRNKMGWTLLEVAKAHNTDFRKLQEIIFSDFNSVIISAKITETNLLGN